MSDSRSLKQARKNAEYTLEQLAAATQLSVSYLSAVETGRKRLTDQLRKKLVEILGEFRDPSSELVPIQVKGTATVPLYRSVVRAGKNSPAVLEDTTDEFDVAKHYEGTCVYEVAGDSMIESGIEEGDRLVVKLGYHFKNRDIILCRYNGELMVKGSAIKDGIIWLFPANSHYHPWPCKPDDEFQCLGTVVEIIKSPKRDWWARVDFNKLSGGRGKS